MRRLADTASVKLAPDVEDLLRQLAPQVLGVLVRRSGDFAAAEDAVQEALIAATVHWTAEGQPVNPRGWLIQVASRRLTDQIRSERARRRREDLAEIVIRRESDAPAASETDDTLALLFMCSHPELTPVSAIALTLRAVGGLSTASIAAAFLVPEATMAQRISRAKQRIKASGGQFQLPTLPEWPERFRTVLHVLYLIFNEGYASSTGAQVHRVELSAEAIRLTRMVREVMPGDAEVTGLLALMLLTDARRPARTGPGGELVALSEQDRTLWNTDAIREGVGLVTAALKQEAIGEYQALAAIAALHDDAPTSQETDWIQILDWYDELEQLTDNPMVTLNRAVALAMVDGPQAGLAELAKLEERLGGHYRLAAVRAHFYEMAGDAPAASRDFRSAAARTTSTAEQNYLLTQAARLTRH